LDNKVFDIIDTRCDHEVHSTNDFTSTAVKFPSVFCNQRKWRSLWKQYILTHAGFTVSISTGVLVSP